MDNLYHALIMGGSVLLFIIGISVAIYNYNKVLEVNDKLLTNSERYSQTSENAQASQYYTVNNSLNNPNTLERIYSTSEVVNMILNMYTVKKVQVDTGEEVIGGYIVHTDANGNHYLSGEAEGVIVSSDIAYKEIHVNGHTYVAGGELTPDVLNGVDDLLRDNNNYIISNATFAGASSVVFFEAFFN